MESIENIKYNPKLTIEQNARLNGLKADKQGCERIRYYIRVKGIDRRHAKQVVIVNAIRKYLKKHPDATKLGASKDLPYGINTIRKYWDIAKTNGEVEQNPNKASKRERLAREQERRRIEFLDSLPIEYIKEYLIQRESNASVAPTKIRQVVETTGTGQCRALIIDFDKTLFNTSFGTEAREAKEWDKVYTCIPQFQLYDGWREVLKWCRENNVKVAIVSGAKTELISRTLEYHNVEVDAVVGFQLYQQKPSRRLVNQALKKWGGVLRKNVLSIGDHILDKQMSVNGRVRFVGAIWDNEHPEHVEELKKGQTISSPSDVIDLLKDMQVVEQPTNAYQVVKYNERTSKSQSPFYGEIAYNDNYAYFYQGVSLSNWAISVPAIPYDGHKFNSSEALYMYLKCKGMGSEKVALKIVQADNDDSLQGNAKFDAIKQLGRKAKFNKAIYFEKREEWMYIALNAKYEADEEFRRTLMDERYRGRTFVEAADADDIWGIGTYITDEVMEFNAEVWMGMNLLGKTLTRVRDEHL